MGELRHARTFLHVARLKCSLAAHILAHWSSVEDDKLLEIHLENKMNLLHQKEKLPQTV